MGTGIPVHSQPVAASQLSCFPLLILSHFRYERTRVIVSLTESMSNMTGIETLHILGGPSVLAALAVAEPLVPKQPLVAIAYKSKKGLACGLACALPSDRLDDAGAAGD